MTAPVVTLAMLHKRGACEDQIALFSKLFPAGEVEVTRESVAAAAVAGLEIGWGALNLLRGQFKRTFDTAMAEPKKVFDAATAEANKAFHAAMTEPRQAYGAATAEPKKAFHVAESEAWKALNAAMAEPKKVFDAARVEPNKPYNAALAEAFSDAFIAQCTIGGAA